MFNFHIDFSYPLFFLLLIPAVLLALIPYFRISKKYRRNRNRITSIVLNLVVMFLCISVLVGVEFNYEVYNAENEIMLVVDASYSTEEEKMAKDDYVQSVLTMANPKIFKVGVVTFGFDQQYAVPLTNDLSSAYEKYLNAPEPDTTATDIAAALTYADSLFTTPEAAKIILISDGLETDESALAVIRTISSRGVRVDTVCTSTLQPDTEVQIINAELPTYNVAADETFDITLSLQSNFVEPTTVTVTVIDNDTEGNSVTADLTSGTTTMVLEHSLSGSGLHTLNFLISTLSDEVSENNSYNSYMYLIAHESILIVEAFEGESEQLYNLLKDNYKPVVVNVRDAEFPVTLAELREYDEVILNNIANSDLPEGFIDILYQYVYEIGGGLFTVGGSEPLNIEDAHAYDRDDMIGTLYQQMLPVQAIDYTPPLGLAIIIDVSGSMSSTSGYQSKLDAAKDSAISIVKDESCLSERDYCGLLTLGSDFTRETDLLPMTRQDEIISAINSLSSGGGTNFEPAIRRASMDLRSLYAQGKIQKMHVIVITDGAAFDYEDYYATVQYYNSLGVTFSFVAIGASSTDMEKLQAAAEAGGGKAVNTSSSNLTIELKDDIRVPEIKDVEYGEFVPTISASSSYAGLISQEDMPSLLGFYGTKVRSSAELVLYGDYGVPIYAQWKFGEGMVGSFMCDLSGKWSANFMTDETGQTFINTVINKLFPTGDIRAKDIEVVLREENYYTQVSIYTKNLGDDETISLQVTNLSQFNSEIVVTQPSEADGYTRATIVAKDPGVYQIIVQRFRGNDLVDECTVYKTLSYSAEYNMFNETDRVQLMEDLAVSGGGSAGTLGETDPYNAFEGLVTSLKKSFDPRFLFIILAIILFLLDIAVRKFKFKWPHEIIRDIRDKKNK